MTTKEYDRDIDILHTVHKSFNASFKRSIEPGSIQVYDSMIVHEHGNHQHVSHKVNENMGVNKLKTIIKIGEFIYVDVIDIAMHQGDCKTHNEHIECTIDKYYMAYGFNWPYFSYGTKLNVIVVLNAFNPSY